MQEYINIAYTDELRPGECKVVKLASQQVALYNVDGTYYATGNLCSHKGGPLGEGQLTGKIVKCPWHNWFFDVTTGQNTQNPEIEVETHVVQVQENRVCLKV